MKVKNYIQLEEALSSDEKIIELVCSINAVNTIKLKEGQKLISNKKNILLSFINGGGIELTGDNEISNISIQTSPDKRAIYIDSNLEDLKEITLKNLTVTGMVQLLTRGNNCQYKWIGYSICRFAKLSGKTYEIWGNCISRGFDDL